MRTVAELCDRHYSKVHASLGGLSGSATVADDPPQETFLRLLTLHAPNGRVQERCLLRVPYTCSTRPKTQTSTVPLHVAPVPAA